MLNRFRRGTCFRGTRNAVSWQGHSWLRDIGRSAAPARNVCLAATSIVAATVQAGEPTACGPVDVRTAEVESAVAVAAADPAEPSIEANLFAIDADRAGGPLRLIGHETAVSTSPVFGAPPSVGSIPTHEPSEVFVEDVPDLIVPPPVPQSPHRVSSTHSGVVYGGSDFGSNVPFDDGVDYRPAYVAPQPSGPRRSVNPQRYGWNWQVITGLSYFNFPTDSRVGSQSVLAGYLPVLDDTAIFVQGNTTLFDGGEQYGGSLGLLKAPTSLRSWYERVGWSVSYNSFTDTRVGSPYIGSFSGDLEAIVTERFGFTPLVAGVRFNQTVTGASIDPLPGVVDAFGQPAGSTPFGGVSTVGGYVRGNIGVNQLRLGAGYLEQADLVTYDASLIRPLTRRIGLRLRGATDSDSNWTGFAGFSVALGRLGDGCGTGCDDFDGCCRADRPAASPQMLARLTQPEVRVGRVTAETTIRAQDAALNPSIVLVAAETASSEESGIKATEFVSLRDLETQYLAIEAEGRSKAKKKSSTREIRSSSDVTNEGGDNLAKFEANAKSYRDEIARLKSLHGPDGVISSTAADRFLDSARFGLVDSFYQNEEEDADSSLTKITVTQEYYGRAYWRDKDPDNNPLKCKVDQKLQDVLTDQGTVQRCVPPHPKPVTEPPVLPPSPPAEPPSDPDAFDPPVDPDAYVDDYLGEPV